MQTSEKSLELTKKERNVICGNCHKEYKAMLSQEDYYKINCCSTNCKTDYDNKQLELQKKLKKDRQEREIAQILPKKYLKIESDMKNIDSLLDKSLFICGKVGVGKTVLIASLVKKYINQGVPVKWISYPSFIMTLQGMFGKNPISVSYRDDNFGQTDNAYKYAEHVAGFKGILAIDDLGAEKMTEFVRQITYYIINEREQNEGKMIITSNYSLKQIDEMIDSRVSSRIVGMCEIKKLEGKDRRFGG